VFLDALGWSGSMRRRGTGWRMAWPTCRLLATRAGVLAGDQGERTHGGGAGQGAPVGRRALATRCFVFVGLPSVSDPAKPTGFAAQGQEWIKGWVWQQCDRCGSVALAHGKEGRCLACHEGTTIEETRPLLAVAVPRGLRGSSPRGHDDGRAMKPYSYRRYLDSTRCKKSL